MMMMDTSLDKKKKQTLEIPRSVSKIPRAAYQDDKSLLLTCCCVDMRQATNLICIEERAFHRSQQLIQVFLPPNLQVLGKQAFKKCERLEKVIGWEGGTDDVFEGSAGLTHMTIGEGAFSHCVKLMEVRLPPNLTVIPSCAFFNCPELQTINLESTMVSRIEESAFEACIKLCQIGLPPVLEEIADHAFLGCLGLTGLTGMTRAGKLKTIGQGALEGCKSLRGTLDLTGTILEEIQADAFKNCSGLRQIKLNAGLTEIESNAFACCVSLEQVVFHPSGNLQTIGPRAFRRCGSLEALEFPASLECIDYEAFYWCFNLVSVQFHPQGSLLSMIAEDAFGYCRLRDVTIPSSVDSLMENSFFADWLERIDVAGGGDRLELSIRLWRMYPDAYVGMPVEKWCYLYCHADKDIFSTFGPGDMEKLDIVKGYVADKLYKLVLWSVSVGSIGT